MSEFALSNLPTLVTQAAASTTIVTAAPEVEELKVDLRQALNFVIEEEEEVKSELSEAEATEAEQRRLDLIMWLLNLELRLSPYTADFA